MALGQRTAVNTESQNSFPRTHWSRIAALKGAVSTERQEALNYLAERYWKPVYCYVRRRGFEPAEAEDMVQEFFLTAFANELFAKADPARGRFRNFLLKSMQHFLAQQWRDRHALKRHPVEGFVSIHKLSSEAEAGVEPKDTETPEDTFNRNWYCELVLRVLHAVEQEFLANGKRIHIDLLRQRIIDPILNGTEAPSLRELADRYALSIKDVENRIITARRAYQRLLREEIRLYASSEDEVAAEIRDLWRFIAD
jgi:DNA-directed RNA polymerase specialized sigma24 family protein